MQKLAIASVAALAAICFSGVAFAEEATTGTWTTITGPSAMTDSEMDGVTAGQATVTGQGPGGGVTVTLPTEASATARTKPTPNSNAGTHPATHN